MIKLIKKNNKWYVIKRQNTCYGIRREQPPVPQNAMYVDSKLIVDENNNPVVFEVNN